MKTTDTPYILTPEMITAWIDKHTTHKRPTQKKSVREFLRRAKMHAISAEQCNPEYKDMDSTNYKEYLYGKR